jgi:hypothetical protein
VLILGLQQKTLETRRNLMKLLDSFAWIEYFIGSERGAKVRNYIESGEPIYVPSICLIEIKSRYLRGERSYK